MQQTSLVVGSNGTIGNALLTKLRAINPSVLGTTHRPSTDPSLLQLNLSDDPSTWNISAHHIHTAYLCAGVCRMNLCEENPAETFKVNVTGMSALAKQLADQGVFVVYLSTNQVFSGNEPHAKTNAPYQPSNEYGRQKVAIETFIRENCPKHAIVRLTKVVEPNMALVKNWISQLSQKQVLRAFYDMPLAPISLHQVVDALIKIGHAQQTGIYHLSGDKDVSYYDLALILAKRLQLDTELVQRVSALDAPIQKNFLPRFTSLDCSSTIALGGLSAVPTLAAVLQECFAI